MSVVAKTLLLEGVWGVCPTVCLTVVQLSNDSTVALLHPWIWGAQSVLGTQSTHGTERCSCTLMRAIPAPDTQHAQVTSENTFSECFLYGDFIWLSVVCNRNAAPSNEGAAKPTQQMPKLKGEPELFINPWRPKKFSREFLIRDKSRSQNAPPIV